MKRRCAVFLLVALAFVLTVAANKTAADDDAETQAADTNAPEDSASTDNSPAEVQPKILTMLAAVLPIPAAIVLLPIPQTATQLMPQVTSTQVQPVARQTMATIQPPVVTMVLEALQIAPAISGAATVVQQTARLATPLLTIAQLTQALVRIPQRALRTALPP